MHNYLNLSKTLKINFKLTCLLNITDIAERTEVQKKVKLQQFELTKFHYINNSREVVGNVNQEEIVYTNLQKYIVAEHCWTARRGQTFTESSGMGRTSYKKEGNVK